MPDEEVAERTLPSPVKVAVLGIAILPIGIGLALLEIHALGAANLYLDTIPYAVLLSLLSLLNCTLLALIATRYFRLERFWFTVGVPLNLAIMAAGAFVLLHGMSFKGVSDGPYPSSGNSGSDIVVPRPTAPPPPLSTVPPSVPMAPQSSAQAPSQLPSAPTSTAPPVSSAQAPASPFRPVATPTPVPSRPSGGQATVGGDDAPHPVFPGQPTPSGQTAREPTAGSADMAAEARAAASENAAKLRPQISMRPFDFNEALRVPGDPESSIRKPHADFNAGAAAPANGANPSGFETGQASRPAPDRTPAMAKTAKATAAEPAEKGSATRAGSGGKKRAKAKDGPVRVAHASGSDSTDSQIAGRLSGGAGEGSPASGGSPPPQASTDTVPSTPQKSDTPINTSAYWNTWFDGGTGPASNILIANRNYTYSLDLSAFNYATLGKTTQSSGVKVDHAFDDVIADLSVPEIILTVKPMIPEGSGLRLADNNASYLMKVDLRKIRKPDSEAADRFGNGLTLISEFSKQVSAGSIQLPVFAESKGCAVIAFAIFKGLLPLDHLVQRVSIGADSTSAPLCDSNDPQQSNALSGGLNSLREVALGMEGSGGSVTAAAALHIFDFASYSMAVFVDGRPGKSQSVYGWQTASSVVEYLKTDNFQNVILKARKDSADNKPGSYIKAAQDLARVVFATRPGNVTEFEAKNAESAFKSLVKDSQESPVIVVRVASSVLDGQNRSIYVPLGILGAQGPGAVLDNPIIVIQPMALERYPSRDRCIGDWTFAVPDGLENVPETVMTPDFFPAKFPGKRISDMDHLREYLAPPVVKSLASVPHAVAESLSADGFVVLAHQDEGFLWFGESTDSIMQENIERSFPAGSVGIFAACSAASPKGRNTALLQKLNERGIDTLIASPFTIDAEYGVVFASSFAEVVQESTASGERPTILKLFDRTIAATAKKFRARTNGNYAELGLEYVLLGNPAITLCTPSAPQAPQ